MGTKLRNRKITRQALSPPFFISIPQPFRLIFPFAFYLFYQSRKEQNPIAGGGAKQKRQRI
jgi:hypothetical protein